MGGTPRRSSTPMSSEVAPAKPRQVAKRRGRQKARSANSSARPPVVITAIDASGSTTTPKRKSIVSRGSERLGPITIQVAKPRAASTLSSGSQTRTHGRRGRRTSQGPSGDGDRACLTRGGGLQPQRLPRWLERASRARPLIAPSALPSTSKNRAKLKVPLASGQEQTSDGNRSNKEPNH